MRRIGSALLLTLFLATIFAGCLETNAAEGEAAAAEAKKLQGKQTVSVFPGEYKFDGMYSQVLAEGPYVGKPPVRTFIQSEIDGVDIEIGYWLPDVPEGVQVPVIVHASPYHRPAGSVIKMSGMKLFLHDNFLPHGYAVGTVAVRGTGDSGGCMVLFGDKEVADLSQAITWFGEQPWSNGNVGMIGVSYDGSTPWEVASTGNPYLKTIVPISGVPDLYNLMFKNGSAELRGPLLLNYLYYTYGYAYADPVAGGDPNRTAEHRIEGVACPESWEGFEAAVYSGTYGERDMNGWWAERNHKPAVAEKYKGSILSVQGLQDWNVDPHMIIPWVQTLADDGLEVKQMLGQWGHASPDRRNANQTPAMWTRYDWAEILLHWFDHYLKEIDSDLGPAVQIQNDKGKWRNEERFPVANPTWKTLHLAGGARLAEEPGSSGSFLLMPNPQGQVGCDQFRSAACSSVDFNTNILDEEILVSGLPRLHVTVSPKGAGGHLAAWLYDVDENGNEKRVGWTQINLRFADGTETSKPVIPNQPIVAKMEFQPLDFTVPAGHILRARVWEFQEADRIPAVPPNAVELLFGGSVTSTLELPIMERSPSDYFEPPMPPEGWTPPAK